MWNNDDRWYSDINIDICGCPDGGEFSPSDPSICCKNGLAWDGSSYNTINTSICGCPSEGNISEIDPNICCKGGLAWNGSSYNTINTSICGCPYTGSSECLCPIGQVYTHNGCEQQPESCTRYDINECGLGYYCNFPVSNTYVTNNDSGYIDNVTGTCTEITGVMKTSAGFLRNSWDSETNWFNANSWCVGLGRSGLIHLSSLDIAIPEGYFCRLPESRFYSEDAACKTLEGIIMTENNGYKNKIPKQIGYDYFWTRDRKVSEYDQKLWPWIIYTTSNGAFTAAGTISASSIRLGGFSVLCD